MERKIKEIKSPPTKEELANRLSKVRALMAGHNLDYYVSFDPVNIYYLTNFANNVHERPFILVIPKIDTPKMIVPLLEKSHVESRSRIDLEFLDYFEFPARKGKNWYDIYEKLFKSDDKIGTESSIPLFIAERTRGSLKTMDLIDEVRIIKTKYEIGRIAHACKIVSRGHKQLLKICRPKTLEFTLYQDVTGMMMRDIIQDIPHANFIVTKTVGAVWPPSFSHDPHIVPNIFTEMEDGGPHVSIVSAQVDGYGVEVERTFFLGNIPEYAKKPFEVMCKARELAYSMLKPGTMMSEIDVAVKKYITNEGFGKYIIHRTGHGLGITGHEAPFIAEGYDKKLTSDMVVSVEPGIYMPKIGGFRHSDTVWITEDGYRKLTEAPETLEELIITL